MEVEQSNNAARNTWNATAVGSQRAEGAPAGSPEYFARIRQYRYGYETPFIPRLMGFTGMAGKKLLEIGVGNGVDAVEMCRAGARYHGVDVTRNHLELTRRNLEINGFKGSLTEGDLTSVAMPDAPFDIVYSFGVLHHITHERAILERVRELLKPDGRLVLAVYSKYSFFNAYLIATWLLRARRRSLDDWRSHLAERSPLGAPVTIRIRSRREVEKQLKVAGFRVLAYEKSGFVKGYLPGIGRFLDADGATLNTLGRLVGWYHIFICEPAGQARRNAGQS